MTSNATLDTLRQAMDTAYAATLPDEAALTQLRRHLSTVRTETNRLYDAKKAAHKPISTAWQVLVDQRRTYQPRIDKLKRNVNSVDADTEQEYRKEISDLIDRLKAAQATYDQVVAERKPAFDAAKRAFDTVREELGRVKCEYKDSDTALQPLREAFALAQGQLTRHAEQTYGARIKRRESDYQLADRVGVPSMYRDDMSVVRKEAAIGFYFGGAGRPDGTGYGYYAIDWWSKSTEHRHPTVPAPADTQSPEDHQDQAEEEPDLLAELLLDLEPKAQDRPRTTQGTGDEPDLLAELGNFL